MRTKSLMIAIALFALVMGMTASSYAAITINPVASIDAKGAVSASSVAPGGVFYVVVQASDVTGISGAAMTLQYDKTQFDVVQSRLSNFGVVTGEVGRVADVVSDIFGSFTPKDTTQGSDNIRMANADATNGVVRFSGAFIDSTTGNSTLTGKANLFAVRFKAKSTATGTSTFTLTKTTLTGTAATAAGWDGTTPVPPLMKAAAKTDAGWSNLTAATGGAFTAFADTEYL